MDGYMTIGEVARVKQVSIKALRYYEKIYQGTSGGW